MVLGCSGSSGDDDDPGSTKPTSCVAGESTGTYLVHFVERSGDCGSLNDRLIRVDDSGLESNCTEDAPTVLSNNDCKVESAVTCIDESTDQRVSQVSVLEELEAGGEKLGGTTTFTVRDAGGMFLCSSTYDVTFTRQ
jgi:hypothetical protein